MKNLLALVLFCFATVLTAQITINSTHAPKINQVYRFKIIDSTAASTLAIGEAGANKTWNFANVKTIDSTFIRTFLDPSKTPKGNQFPTATLAEQYNEEGETTYNYIRVTTNAYELIGTVTGDTVEKYTNPQVRIRYPVTYNTNFKDTSVIIIPDILTGENDTSIILTEVNVDAYGTITTGLGTFNCLRVKTTANTEVVFFGIPIPITVTAYNFVTTNYGAQILEHITIESSAFPDLKEVTADVMDRLSTGTKDIVNAATITAYPNPVTTETILEIDLKDTKQAALALVDANGRIVLRQTIQEGLGDKTIIKLDVSNIPTGIYFAIIGSEKGQIGMKKIVVNR